MKNHRIWFDKASMEIYENGTKMGRNGCFEWKDGEVYFPFRMTLPKVPYNAERGYRAMVEISEGAEKNGVADMTLDEINAEIDASRRERNAVNGKVQIREKSRDGFAKRADETLSICGGGLD